MSAWPRYKRNHSMGYFTDQDMPFQFALAEAFTICDAYHCSFMGNTNPNRLFLWTGTNDPLQAERRPRHLQPVRQRRLRSRRRLHLAHLLRAAAEGGHQLADLPEHGRQLHRQLGGGLPHLPRVVLRANRAPIRSWRKARPLHARSRPAPAGRARRQAAASVLDRRDGRRLRAPRSRRARRRAPTTPRGCSRRSRPTRMCGRRPCLIVNFDENDGFFDHVPPPAAPSYEVLGRGREQARARRRLHRGHARRVPRVRCPGTSPRNRAAPLHQALRPRPARADVRRLSVEQGRLGQLRGLRSHLGRSASSRSASASSEPNISAWRRAVAGDLTSAFNFGDPDDSAFYDELPDTVELAERARELLDAPRRPRRRCRSCPFRHGDPAFSRALPYELHAHANERTPEERARWPSLSPTRVRAGAVFHVYDRKHLERIPRRYTVGAGDQIGGEWDVRADGGAYDLWVLGPNAVSSPFHRQDRWSPHQHRAPEPEIRVEYECRRHGLRLRCS